MRKLYPAVLLSLVVMIVVSNSPAAESSDEDAVKATVERFLTSLGSGDYEAVPAMFAPKATISHPAKVDGKWTMTNETFDEWMAARLASPTRPKFREPVNEFTVHVDDGLAFVRADANFYVGDELRSNNLDYFTLIKIDGEWKFVNASYVNRPVAKRSAQ
jgi:ketosteroid isomerase-like protein